MRAHHGAGRTGADGFSAIRDGFKRINEIGISIGFTVLFPAVTVTPPGNVHPELDFIRLVSWLYAQWHEVGRVSITIVRRAIDIFDPDSGDLVPEHLGNVASHRTLLHHDLGGEIERGGRTTARCEGWFNEACGTAAPIGQDAWRAAYEALCEEARVVLETSGTTLRRLGFDAGSVDWVRSWRVARERQLNDGDLDTRISTLARQMGLGVLRAPEFRRRFRARWADQVRLCPATEIPATLDRAITRDLLDFGKGQHPLVPTDVIAHLGLEEGPLVGEAMQLARRLYAAHPCSHDELLIRLLENWQQV